MLVERGLNVLAHNIRDREVDAEIISLLERNPLESIANMRSIQTIISAARSSSRNAQGWHDFQVKNYGEVF